MKKVIGVFLMILLLCSCSDRQLDSVGEQSALTEVNTADDAVSITRSLIPKADELYRIFYRCSIAADENIIVTEPNGFRYSPVSEKYQTLDELKGDAEKTFTLQYLENNFYVNLNDDYAYFKDIDGRLYKNIDAVSEGENTWYPEQTEILEQSTDGFTAKVPYTDLYDTQRSAKLEVIKDGEDWKIAEWVLDLPSDA